MVNGKWYEMNEVALMEWRRDRYDICSIRIWAGIMAKSRKPLHALETGIKTSVRYLVAVLIAYAHLFLAAFGDNFLFINDNSFCTRASIFSGLSREFVYSSYHVASTFIRL